MSNYQSGTFDSKYGVIHMSNPGPKADPPYENVRTYAQPGTNNTITLQGPALRAFKAAELAQTPRRLRRRGKVRPIRVTGHGYRSYAYQYSLYLLNGKDGNPPGRYANPDGSMHVEALAVDLDTSATNFAAAKRALIAEGFHFAVDGEPWHGSFRLSG